MNTNESQLEFVKRLFKTNGKVSRNQCLRSFISRLSSIIFRLKESGMDISGEFVPTTTPFGTERDFVYTWTNPDVEIKTTYIFNFIEEGNNKASCKVTAENFKNACSIFLMQPPIFLFAVEEEVFDNFGSENSILTDQRFKELRTYSSKK